MNEMQKKEAIEELKYRLILVKNCDDDPITQVYLIRKLKETYEKHDIEISDKVQTYLTHRINIIKKTLKEDYNEKVQSYQKLKEKHEKKKIEHKRKDIFGW